MTGAVVDTDADVVLGPADVVSTVLVCHERRLLGEGAARLIERHVEADVQVAGTPAEARRLLASRHFDLAVCSDAMASEAPFVELARARSRGGEPVPLLVLARTEGRQSVAAAERAGAAGYVALATVHERLGAAAARVLDGGTAFPHIASALDGPRLTPRELEVVQGFDLGLSDKEIAIKLKLSVSTVKTHARAIYAKLGVSSRTRAIHEARKLELI